MGLDEAYLELSGLPRPTLRCAGSAPRSSAPPGSAARSGSGRTSSWRRSHPTRRSRAGFVVLSREQAWRGSRRHRVGSCRESGRRRPSGCAGSGSTRSASLPAHRRPRWRPRSGRASRRSCSAAPASRTMRPSREERKVISESREITFDFDIAELGQLELVLDGLVQRLCAGAGRAAPRWAHVGIKVRLDDFSTHTRARTLAEPVARPTTWARWRSISCGASRRRDRCGCWECVLPGFTERSGGGGAAHPAALIDGTELIERSRQPPARLARKRVLDAELVEDANDHAADVLPGAIGGRQRARAAGRALAPDRRRRARRTRRQLPRRAPASARARSVTRARRRRSSPAHAPRSRAPRRPRRGRAGSARAAPPRPRACGSSSTARRSDASSPAAVSCSASDGTQRVEEALDRRRAAARR